MRKIAKIRVQKYAEQGGLCFYCQQPMWESDPLKFAQSYKLSRKRLSWLRSTAEHLLPRQEGGADLPMNIVAACAYCNSHRHHCRMPRDPNAHTVLVRKRLNEGRWHGLQLRRE